jgi:RNA polymerase sigma-70 factor (ECF subfamily)
MPEQTVLEDDVKAAWERGDFDDAATRFLAAYGAEILGFLVTRVRDKVDARDVFSEFCEDFLRGLPDFAWRCTMRGWAYTLAKHAADRFLRSPKRRRERNLTLPAESRCSKLVHQLRTGTLPYKKSEVRDKVQALREQLSQDDQTLLTLHLDRGLSWNEVAMVMDPEGESLSGTALKVASGRMRQRFHAVKERLRKIAEQEGLLRGGTDA